VEDVIAKKMGMVVIPTIPQWGRISQWGLVIAQKIVP